MARTPDPPSRGRPIDRTVVAVGLVLAVVVAVVVRRVVVADGGVGLSLGAAFLAGLTVLLVVVVGGTALKG
jgi:hypothetical protein